MKMKMFGHRRGWKKRLTGRSLLSSHPPATRPATRVHPKDGQFMAQRLTCPLAGGIYETIGTFSTREEAEAALTTDQQQTNSGQANGEE